MAILMSAPFELRTVDQEKPRGIYRMPRAGSTINSRPPGGLRRVVPKQGCLSAPVLRIHMRPARRSRRGRAEGMKILLVNYRYFVSGGPERYLFAVKNALEAQGHEIVPFSIHYSRNEPTPYARYFVPPLAGPDAVKFRDHAWTARSAFKTLERSFYSPEVERAVDRLIRDTRPDVAYVLHYLKKLSPAVLVGIKKHHLPLVVRISDFLMLCPQALFLRDGKPCTLCAGGALWPSIRYRCVTGSLSASIIHALATRYHRRRRFFDLVDRFVLPSEFTLEKMAEAGWPRERLVHIPTFVSPAFLQAQRRPGERTILFVGHLEPHKGGDLLIEAYARARGAGASLPPLTLVGGLSSPFATHCRELAARLGVAPCVEFLDFMSEDRLAPCYANALFTVVPSLWYENAPNVILESYAAARPVLGSAHGSIRPLILEGKTGRSFRPGDADDLANHLRWMASHPEWCDEAGRQARAYAEEHLSVERHRTALIALFEQVLSASAR
jgi:glycosyltransferase involved in cell wall biosynthesis